MFVSRVTTKKFGVLADGTYTLTDNFNIIRGKNEKGKCVTGDTLIHTGKGLVRIDSLDCGFKEGFTDIEEVTYSSRGAHRIDKFYKEYNKETFEVLTSNGLTVTGTKNHPLLTYNPKTAEHEYVNIADLRVGDWLCVDKNISSFPAKECPLNLQLKELHHNATKLKLPDTMSPELAKVLGYLTANGSGSGPTLTFSSNSKELIGDLDSNLKVVGLKTSGEHRSKGVVQGLRINSRAFKDFIEAIFGLETFPTARFKSVPKAVLQSSRESQLSFLTALFDCDSYRGLDGGFEWVTASKQLSDEVVQMLLNFGVVSNTSPKEVSGYDHTYIRVKVTGWYSELLLSLLEHSIKYRGVGYTGNSHQDTIPGLNDYIRWYSKTVVKVTLAGHYNSNGGRKRNTAFKGTTGQPQASMHVDKLSQIADNVKTMSIEDERWKLLNHKLDEIRRLNYRYVKIQGISGKGHQTVYDISVPETKSFVANGIVSHNSTLVEATLYAMFGTGSIRGTIDETVRDGHKAADLRAEIEYGPYTACRTKSSASVTGNGINITGQANVSEFFYDLLGIRKGSEDSVLVSQQGKTAGILDGKPGEVSSLIEGMAGFNQLDNVLENAKAKYPAGNATMLEEMIAEVSNKLAGKREVILESPDSYLQSVVSGEASAVVKSEEIKSAQNTIAEKEKELVRIEEGAKLKEKLGNDVAATEKKISNTVEAIADNRLVSKKEIPDVSAETALVNDYPTAVKNWNLYVKISSFKWEGDEWDGSVENLNEEYSKECARAKSLASSISENEAEVRQLKRQINDEDKCPSCGQDTKHLHEEINAKAEAGIAAKSKDLEAFKKDLAEVQETKAVMLDIHNEQMKRSDYEAYATDLESLPWRLKWPGEVPSEPSQEKFYAAQSAIAKAEKVTREVAGANSALITLGVSLEELETSLVTLRSEFNSTFVMDGSDLKSMITILKNSYKGLVEELDVINATIKENQREADRLTNEAKILARDITSLEEEIKSLNKKLSVDARNSQIIKQIRTARPKVLNRVWSSVLTMVSATFSELRGEESTVSKSEKGFYVNGIPVHRLSGSAKSILGIALRVALREIFAPSAGFLVFDEPASDADGERTAMVTGALAAVRGQVIAITHEDISDSSADNIIEL
jgi:intein/homing endonuclease